MNNFREIVLGALFRLLSPGRSVLDVLSSPWLCDQLAYDVSRQAGTTFDRLVVIEQVMHIVFGAPEEPARTP